MIRSRTNTYHVADRESTIENATLKVQVASSCCNQCLDMLCLLAALLATATPLTASIDFFRLINHGSNPGNSIALLWYWLQHPGSICEWVAWITGVSQH